MPAPTTYNVAMGKDFASDTTKFPMVRTRHTAEPYDICKLVESGGKELFPTSKKTNGGYAFWDPPERYSLGVELNRGASGRVYKGTFGSLAVAIKVNDTRKVKRKTDEDELRMQLRLHCLLNDEGALRHDAASPAAMVPKVLFAAQIPRVGRGVGMERVDESMLAMVLRTPNAEQIRALRRVLRALVRLLVFLQDRMQFMHGDLHAENVMMRGSDVFLIDFGMASVVEGGKKRFITDDRYRNTGFNSSLDMLTLLTVLREDLALENHESAARWCHAFIAPFWDVVVSGLTSGKARAKLAYGAHRIVQVARNEIRESGEVYYAHHLLYESMTPDVSYPPCTPKYLLTTLKSQKVSFPHPPPNFSKRIFEGV